jgi:recombination protein RecA
VARSSVKTQPSGAPGAGSANASEKARQLEAALGKIEKDYGKGSIMRFGDYPKEDIPAISTGALSLDLALGIGGVPRGRIVEIFGPESSGKTTLALHVAANAQRAGGMVAYIDAEHAMDPVYCKKLGVNLDELLISQPDSGEQALDICEQLTRSGAIDLIVVDSVAALVPRAEIEGEMGDSFVGLQARLMSQAMRKLTGALARAKTTLIFINQIREKIGVMFGSPETTPGGRALKFYASVRLDIRRIGAIKDGEANIGNRVRVKVVKNKCAPPFLQAEFDILFGHGISYEGDLLDLAVVHTIVEKSGAWLSFQGERIGQGRDKSIQFLKEHPDAAQKIQVMLKERFTPDFDGGGGEDERPLPASGE